MPPLIGSIKPYQNGLYQRRKPCHHIPGFKASRLQGFKASRLQGFKASRLQGFKASRLQGFKASRLQGFKASLSYFARKWDPPPGFLARWLCLLVLLLGFFSSSVFAQGDPFSIPAPADTVKKQTVNLEAVSLNVDKQTLALSVQNINGLAITASFGLRFGSGGSFQPDDPSAFVRVVLVDNDTQDEFLVYQKNYQDLTTEEYNTPTELTVNAICRETCALPQTVKSATLRAEARHGGITVTEISYVDTPLTADAATLRKEQNDIVIEKLNEQDLGWIAGETSVSNLTYAEKKRLVNLTDPNQELNLQGFEYYRGGIFELKSKDTTGESRGGTRESALVDKFDWRNKHGKNWVTSVKHQGSCGSCYAHSSIGTVEAVAKLYFNDSQWDLNLSEQEVLSCGGTGYDTGVSYDGTCPNGGWGVSVLKNYVAKSGVVDEECFSYQEGLNENLPYQSCSLKCANPKEKIQISGVATPFSPQNLLTEEELKKVIIENGPVDSGINTLSHAMLLVGFETDPKDGRTIWIFKNSWGGDWGGTLPTLKDEKTGKEYHWGDYQSQGHAENGYAYIKLDTDNIVNVSVAELPITSFPSRQISCVDEDNDTYCNWGISKDKPSTCPASCKPEKDCDDSNAEKGPFDAKYNCPNTNNQPDPQPPVAVFKVLPANKGEAPFTVTLDASSSSDLDGTITKYDWSQVRANTREKATSIASSDKPTQSHTFSTPGQFEVVLTVTDSQGKQAEEHKIVTVTGGQSQLIDLEAVEGNTFAWDTSGNPTKSGAILKGGISVAGGAYSKLVKFADNLGHGSQAQSVTIKGSITPDPQHANKIADIFAFGEFTPYGDNLKENTCPVQIADAKAVPFYVMASLPKNYVAWEGAKTPSTIPAFLYKDVTLKSGEAQEFTLFEGPFDARGCLSISFGYRLKDSGIVVYNHHTATVDNTIGVTVRKK